jgi:hypothetical protein
MTREYDAPNPTNLGMRYGAAPAAPPPPSQRGWSLDSGVVPRVGTPGPVRDHEEGLPRGESHVSGGVSEAEVEEVEGVQDVEKGLSVKK